MQNYGRIEQSVLENLYGELVKETILSNYTFPTKKSTDGFYHIWIPDQNRKGGRRQLKASTIEILKNKVLELYDTPSFEELYAATQDEALKYVKTEEKRYSVSNTVTRKDHHYKRFFLGTAFEKTPINKITTKDIKEICIYNLERYELRRKSFNAMIGIIRQVFRYATDENYIFEDITKRIDFHSPKLVNMLSPESDIEERIYTDDEIQSMLSYCHDWQEKYPKRPTAFALEYQILIGKRRGEVCPSKWSDIKTEGGVRYIEISRELLEVKKSKYNPHEYCRIVEHTKTSMDRRVPIWNEMDEFLKRLWTQHQLYFPDTDFMFPAKTEFGCINIRTVYYTFHKMCKELSIPLSSDQIKGPHAFRRNFAKRIDNAELASKLLGNDVRVLKKNYYDGLDLKKALDILNSSEEGNQTLSKNA